MSYCDLEKVDVNEMPVGKLIAILARAQATYFNHILAEIGKQKSDSQCVVGFALETEHEMDNAVSKLKNKNADIIVLNSLKNQGAGFQCPTNLVTLIDRTGKITKGELKDKREVAQDIVNYIVDYMKIK